MASKRFAIVIGAAAFVSVIGLAGSASAIAQSVASASGRTSDLATETLATSDLPAGFQPYGPMTGPLDSARARQLGGTFAAQAAQLLHGWIRWWFSGQTRQQVIEEVWDAGTRGGASEASASSESSVLARGALRQQITAGLAGYTYATEIDNTRYTAVGTAIGRGPFLFAFLVLTPGQPSAADVGLVRNLVAAQERKVPADTPNTGTSLSDLEPDPYNAAGGVVGTLLGYLAIVSGIAYLRNPLRRGRRRNRSVDRSAEPAGQHVLDVSSAARRYLNTARCRLVVQLVGLSLIACGADPFLVSRWYLFVLAGAVVTWAGGRFIHPAGVKASRNRSALSGGRRLRVTFLMSLASVLVVVSVPLFMTYALHQSEPSVVQEANAASGGLPVQGYEAFAWVGIVLLGAGAIISRHARRLAAVDANRATQRDTRAPVLYLRSFGDDSLKLWTATLGRPSLLERFTPRRFDTFEEVIARQFSATGPVIALNPPGTKLAPLGAARETLDSADWEATIADWMSRSAVIVLVAPPGQVTPGLTWELQQVSTSQHWDRTLILVPPVGADLLQTRWHSFLAALGTLWPFTLPMPVGVPTPLVLTLRDGAWTTFRADRQNEWAYSAAVREAVAGMPLPATAAAPT